MAARMTARSVVLSVLLGAHPAWATAAELVRLTDDFGIKETTLRVALTRMVGAGRTGCLVFTSSAAAAVASPFTCLYAATKACVSSFGASLAVEARHRGIDVLVFHPSPVASRFYDRAHKLGVLDFFRGVAVHPDALPPAVFGAVGRTAWRDVGPTAVAFRLMMKLVDFNAMATLSALAAPLLPDFKLAVADAAAKAKKR